VDTWKIMMYSEILEFHQIGDSTTPGEVPTGELTGGPEATSGATAATAEAQAA
jgi:p38 MAP kinase